MTFDEMTALVEAEFDWVRNVRETKGKEYAGENDTLADFKEAAEQLDVSPLVVWSVYVKKHERAIDSFVREGSAKSEAIEDRVRDVIVYHLLLLGLLRDAGEATEEDAAEGPGVRAWEPPPSDGSRSRHPNPYEILDGFRGRQVTPSLIGEANGVLQSHGWPGVIVGPRGQGEESMLSYIEDPEAEA